MPPENSKYIIQEDVNNNDNKEWRKFPYEIVKLDPEINSQMLKDFTGEKTGFVQVGPEKWFLPSGYEKAAEILYNFKVRTDDVWVVTFPRSGTTWIQEMVWQISNNFDYNTAEKIPLTERFPFLEFSTFVHPQTKAEFLNENSFCKKLLEMTEIVTAPAWNVLNNQIGKRFIKTHLPFTLLPPDLLTCGCKVIYVARNPKDVCISFYHLNKLIRTQGFLGDFPTFWNYFQRNLHPWSPYWSHIQEGWNRRHSKNMLFMFYEEINKNLHDGITQVANFLDKTITEEQMNDLKRHLDIENFRNNKSVNFNTLKELGILNKGQQPFVRNGKNGAWIDSFTAELNRKADNWIEEHLTNTDLRFPLSFLDATKLL